MVSRANNFMGEFEFIDWIRSQTPKSPGVFIGPGDDAAFLKMTPGKGCLITTDMLLEGSCFILKDAGPYRVGRKAMAVNLSDMAAMAGKPTSALVSVALPRKEGGKIAKDLFQGVKDLAEEFGVAIVGGDTNSWQGPLCISITLLGEETGKGPVPRSGAKPGDWILVTGVLGGSILGKHLDFRPRVHEAFEIHRLVDLHAMIDISDGLAADINHICEESHCGAVLRGEQVPISPEAKKLAESTDGKSALDHALSDGEDFELAFMVTPAEGLSLIETQPIPGIRLTHIGECVNEGLWLELKGVRSILKPSGYVHELD